MANINDIPINVSTITNLNYNIDFDFVGFNNLPQFYLWIENYRIIQSILGSQSLHYNTFLSDREQFVTETYLNSTIAYETYLNDKYDNVERGIEIINRSFAVTEIYLYKELENGDVTENNTYFYNEDELLAGEDENKTYMINEREVSLETDFTIRIPNRLLLLGITVQEIVNIIDKRKKIQNLYDVEIY